MLYETESDVDRVREHGPQKANIEQDQLGQTCVQAHGASPPEQITAHLEELSREWDIERFIQTNASLLALGGTVLGATVSRKFLALPAVVFSFLFQHAVQGWCPPVPLFRRMGIRTRKEINREKYALKALRGDFDHVNKP